MLKNQNILIYQKSLHETKTRNKPSSWVQHYKYKPYLILSDGSLSICPSNKKEELAPEWLTGHLIYSPVGPPWHLLVIPHSLAPVAGPMDTQAQWPGLWLQLLVLRSPFTQTHKHTQSKLKWHHVPLVMLKHWQIAKLCIDCSNLDTKIPKCTVLVKHYKWGTGGWNCLFNVFNSKQMEC